MPCFHCLRVSDKKSTHQNTTKDKKKQLVDVFAFRCRWCWIHTQKHRVISTPAKELQKIWNICEICWKV